MNQYSNEGQAVARAMNAGEGKPTPAKWQSQYTAGYRETPANDCELLTGMDRLLADAMTNSCLHRALTDTHYQVLVLRYSADEPARVKAVRALMAVVGTNSGPNSRALSIGAWASKAYKEPARNWDQQDVSDRTLQAWRSEIKKTLDRLHGEAMTAAHQALRETGKIGVDGAAALR